MVNNTVDGFYQPIYKFTYKIAYPLILLNETLDNFSIQMNNTFNESNVSLGLSTSMVYIVINGFPSKLTNVMAYYLIWLIILIIFKQDV